MRWEASSLPELDLINNATVLQLQQSYTTVSLLHFHAAELCYLPCFKQCLLRADRLMHSNEPITVSLAHHESIFVNRRIDIVNWRIVYRHITYRRDLWGHRTHGIIK